MRKRLMGLVAASLILPPVAASAQYYGGDFDRRGGDVHVDRYHHGDHDDDVIHRPHRDYRDRAYYGESRSYGEPWHRHHHHHDEH